MEVKTTMFLKKCIINGIPYGYIVKSVRVKLKGGGSTVRHKIIEYLGRIKEGRAGKQNLSEINKAIKEARNK